MRHNCNFNVFPPLLARTYYQTSLVDQFLLHIPPSTSSFNSDTAPKCVTPSKNFILKVRQSSPSSQVFRRHFIFSSLLFLTEASRIFVNLSNHLKFSKLLMQLFLSYMPHFVSFHFLVDLAIFSNNRESPSSLFLLKLGRCCSQD